MKITNKETIKILHTLYRKRLGVDGYVASGLCSAIRMADSTRLMRLDELRTVTIPFLFCHDENNLRNDKPWYLGVQGGARDFRATCLLLAIEYYNSNPTLKGGGVCYSLS